MFSYHNQTVKEITHKIAPLHAMKTYGGGGSIILLIRKIDTKRRRVCSFTTRPLYPWTKTPNKYSAGGWLKPSAALRALEKKTACFF